MEKSRQSANEDGKSPACKLISAKRIGIISIVGLGLLAAYFYEGDETEVRPPKAVQQKAEKISHDPVAVLTEKLNQETNEKRREYLKQLIEMLKNSQAEAVKPEPFDPSVHFAYLNQLIEEYDGSESDKERYKLMMMGCMEYSDDSGYICEKDWQSLGTMIDNFDESEMEQSFQSLFDHCMKLVTGPKSKPCTDLNEAVRSDYLTNDNWLTLSSLASQIENAEDKDGVLEIFDAEFGNVMKIDSLLTKISSLHQEYPDLITEEIWQSLSDMPQSTPEEIEEKLKKLQALQKELLSFGLFNLE